MAFRLYDFKPQFRDDAGAIVAGGTITFTASGTTTPLSVYGEEALSTDLGNIIDLEADGRPADDIWLGTGPYRVVVKDSDGVVVPGCSLDNVHEQGNAAVTLPDPSTATDGQVLASDGADWEFIDVLAVPDPSGSSGKQLGTDGSAVFWEAKADAVDLPDGGIDQDSNSFQIGKLLVQFDTDSAPITGDRTASKAITFDTVYDSTPKGVQLTVEGSSFSTNGGIPAAGYTNLATTGFTAHFVLGELSSPSSAFDLNAAVPFSWEVKGLVA